MKGYFLRFTAEELQAVIDELDGCGLPGATSIREKLLSLQLRRSGSTAGVFEFRGLDCTFCAKMTSHFKKYKSSDPWVCDECGGP